MQRDAFRLSVFLPAACGAELRKLKRDDYVQTVQTGQPSGA